MLARSGMILCSLFAFASAWLVRASHQSEQASLQKPYAPGPLMFKADGAFQISILEDLHFGESELPGLSLMCLACDLTLPSYIYPPIFTSLTLTMEGFLPLQATDEELSAKDEAWKMMKLT